MKKGLVYCEVCGEPSRNEVCKVCSMMKQLKTSKH